jgi:2-amino-4-hydroxy-6-hydroxymethyldihydropteridine diphosphokinase
MADRVTCFIGLGSNLDHPLQQVQLALEELAGLPSSNLLAYSPLYRSAPVGPQDQDDFINAVARIETALDPWHLLDELQSIENSHQRVRNRHWGPRSLDLDILLYGTRQLNDDRLVVPHAQIPYRSFVLQPLKDLVGGGFAIESMGTLDELLAECPANALDKLPEQDQSTMKINPQ